MKWEGYSHEENMWEIFENVNENARELLEEFYSENGNMEKDKWFVHGKSEEKKDVKAQPDTISITWKRNWKK